MMRLTVTIDDEDLQQALEELIEMPRKVYKTVARQVSDIGQAAFDVATKTWESKPDVQIYSEVGAGLAGGQWLMYVSLTPRGIPYLWVDQGTRGPYPIVAKRAKALAFRSGYNAKTRTPGALPAIGGGPVGAMVFRQKVTHPGLRPRFITRTVGEVVEREMGPLFENEVYNEVDRAWA